MARLVSDQERLTYTVAEAAALLGVSEQHLRNLVYEERIPALWLGRRVLINRSVVARLLAEAEFVEEDRPAGLRALR